MYDFRRYMIDFLCFGRDRWWIWHPWGTDGRGTLFVTSASAGVILLHLD